MNVIEHYDKLIEENNDPFHDSPLMQEYMNKWDGIPFISAMQLNKNKKVLEIGIGTGRIATKVAPLCSALVGIDISPKTIERAKINLAVHKNISLICDDFISHSFDSKFDVIYSSLTMMHFKNKLKVINKVSNLLSESGIFCLSIDKNQSEWLDYGNRKIKIYPDNLENIKSLTQKRELKIVEIIENEFYYSIVSHK